MRIPALLFTLDSQRRVLIVLVLLIGLTITAFSMSRWTATRSSDTQELAASEPVKVLHFTLTPLGFNPSAMTVPEGLYVIDVTNRSGLSTFSLNLGRLSGHKLKEVDTARKRGEWSGYFRLKKDDFVLTVNEKTAWTASLEVTK